jgi:hypothetical protein
MADYLAALAGWALDPTTGKRGLTPQRAFAAVAVTRISE